MGSNLPLLAGLGIALSICLLSCSAVGLVALNNPSVFGNLMPMLSETSTPPTGDVPPPAATKGSKPQPLEVDASKTYYLQAPSGSYPYLHTKKKCGDGNWKYVYGETSTTIDPANSTWRFEKSGTSKGVYKIVNVGRAASCMSSNKTAYLGIHDQDKCAVVSGNGLRMRSPADFGSTEMGDFRVWKLSDGTVVLEHQGCKKMGSQLPRYVYLDTSNNNGDTAYFVNSMKGATRFSLAPASTTT